jgi:cation:H+ antiporter
MTVTLLLIAVGLIALVVGADQAVGGARNIALRFGISELIIGLTITSIGTSLPELATAASAALASDGADAAAGVAVGNLLGSNLFLMTGLLGGAALIRTIQVDRGLLGRDSFVLVGATLAALAVMANGTVTPLEGGLLLLAYVTFLIGVVVQERRRIQRQVAASVAAAASVSAAASDAAAASLAATESTAPAEATADAVAEPVAPAPPKASNLRLVFDAVRTVAGLAGVLIGADLIVDNGVDIATTIGISGTLIGVFVGIGTSLPELVVSVQAALKGASDISVGNIVGSAITNLLLCLGAAAVVSPIAVPPTALSFDLPFTLAATIVALALMFERRDVTRTEGVALITIFGLYMYLRAAGVVG